MNRLKPLPILLLAFVAFYLLPLGLHGLWTPDETRYAQISQEMLQSGNWVAPHFMGIRYFEKPAGGYWLIALGQAVFGQNLFGVRIASAVTSGLSVLLAYLIARRLWNDPRKSFACALLYLSFGLVAGQAGYSNLDPQFTLWVNLSLVALWFALESTKTRARLCAWAVLGLACGMGFLTKGFLAWALPVLIAVPYMLWQRRLGELLRYGPLAMAVAVLVCLPWALAIHLQEPDFWRFFSGMNTSAASAPTTRNTCARGGSSCRSSQCLACRGQACCPPPCARPGKKNASRQSPSWPCGCCCRWASSA